MGCSWVDDITSVLLLHYTVVLFSWRVRGLMVNGLGTFVDGSVGGIYLPSLRGGWVGWVWYMGYG